MLLADWSIHHQKVATNSNDFWWFSWDSNWKSEFFFAEKFLLFSPIKFSFNFLFSKYQFNSNFVQLNYTIESIVCWLPLRTKVKINSNLLLQIIFVEKAIYFKKTKQNLMSWKSVKMKLKILFQILRIFASVFLLPLDSLHNPTKCIFCSITIKFSFPRTWRSDPWRTM